MKARVLGKSEGPRSEVRSKILNIDIQKSENRYWVLRIPKLLIADQ
jgi:hypothetical protein